MPSDSDSTPEPGLGAVRDEDIVDVLPEDLDLAAASAHYLLPNNNRRRIPAALYGVLAIGAAVLWATQRDTSAIVNDGFGWFAIIVGAFSIYGFVAGRTLLIDETDALTTANSTVGFAIGHASAQMVWRGWLSRPVWRLLAYSTENPPAKRALVLVDGISGDVVEWFAEDNPEDWARSGAGNGDGTAGTERS
ncbi:MAG TPA: hypothetical protein PKD80_02910 [Microthrixaceae bacterium]|nr:hypothetical protein [Microthrixaceae bacterium]HMT23209.1 hypothetical protein [Microthrixaceae bacterium]HMT60846.1 hypothetical protein [Microthrixaceae bacterium]